MSQPVVDGRAGEGLTPAEVAELLGVTVKTVGRLSDAGSLPSTRTPGGHRRFRQQDVDTYLRGDVETEPPPARPAPASRPTTTPDDTSGSAPFGYGRSGLSVALVQEDRGAPPHVTVELDVARPGAPKHGPEPVLRVDGTGDGP